MDFIIRIVVSFIIGTVLGLIAAGFSYLLGDPLWQTKALAFGILITVLHLTGVASWTIKRDKATLKDAAIYGIDFGLIFLVMNLTDPKNEILVSFFNAIVMYAIFVSGLYLYRKYIRKADKVKPSE
ncbi:hypothetical protein phiOC_p411 [Ochrobactrum phage vB_OspM_OC]|nr:hypothetical protein phiOC_p411 [Ochrobactrum phage vB_OspM_OC]